MIGEQTRTLDNHINAHFAEIRLLREQRNAACSRTRGMPPEILSKIFGIVYRSCRHAAPLNEPTLWTEKVERYELCQRLSRIQHTNHPAKAARSPSRPSARRHVTQRTREII